MLSSLLSRPGDYLRPGEDEESGLQARMDHSLGVSETGEGAVSPPQAF